MKRNLLIPISAIALYSFGCASVQRSQYSGYNADGSKYSGTYDFKTSGNSNRRTSSLYTTSSYELGIDPNLAQNEQSNSIEIRSEIRMLESKIGSKKEQVQYSKAIPWFNSDQEKLEFLRQPNFESKQLWLNQNNIFARSQNPNPELLQVAEQQDIAVGMPEDLVKQAWGEPDIVEIAGNPIYKNERWKYSREVSSIDGFKTQKRYIYFESGKVVGWETQ